MRLRAHLGVALAALAAFASALPAATGASERVGGLTLRHAANAPDPAIGTDLAFWGALVFAGNYDGFRIFDVSRPAAPRRLARVRCHGPQNDISVHGAGRRLLVFLSVDRPQTSSDCAGSTDTPEVTVEAQRYASPGFEGIRVFDVTDPRMPRQIAAVPTSCGSHTHTTIPDPRRRRLLLYVASYPLGTGVTPPGYPAFRGPRCALPHRKISIVEVPFVAPRRARVLKEQPLHEDTRGFGGGGVVACHDIQAFVSRTRKIVAAACGGEGQLWDISDPANPTTLRRHTHVRNRALDFWHSAAFTWDGKVVVFGDEALGRDVCTGRRSTRGNLWFYRLVRPGGRSRLLGRYALPRPQPGYCSLHLFNIIPARDGSYVGVASAYGGGTTVFDFTNPDVRASSRSSTLGEGARAGPPTSGRRTGTTAGSTRTTSAAASTCFGSATGEGGLSALERWAA